MTNHRVLFWQRIEELDHSTFLCFSKLFDETFGVNIPTVVVYRTYHNRSTELFKII